MADLNPLVGVGDDLDDLIARFSSIVTFLQDARAVRAEGTAETSTGPEGGDPGGGSTCRAGSAQSPRYPDHAPSNTAEGRAALALLARVTRVTASTTRTSSVSSESSATATSEPGGLTRPNTPEAHTTTLVSEPYSLASSRPPPYRASPSRSGVLRALTLPSAPSAPACRAPAPGSGTRCGDPIIPTVGSTVTVGGGGVTAGSHPPQNPANCCAPVAFPDPEARWYVITRGIRVGVFQGWANVQPFVTGVRHACFWRTSGRDEALRRYAQALEDGLVRVLSS